MKSRTMMGIVFTILLYLPITPSFAPDALATSMFLNSFFRHAHIVKMANLAHLVNVIAPIFTNEEGLYLQQERTY